MQPSNQTYASGMIIFKFAGEWNENAGIYE